MVHMLAGLPVSTTQVITGALISVGLTEGIRGVNWWAVLRVSFCFMLAMRQRHSRQNHKR